VPGQDRTTPATCIKTVHVGRRTRGKDSLKYCTPLKDLPRKQVHSWKANTCAGSSLMLDLGDISSMFPCTGLSIANRKANKFFSSAHNECHMGFHGP
jgi:hypothetical protein